MPALPGAVGRAGPTPRRHNGTMQRPEAIVLFAHGARDARWAQSLHALAGALRAHAGQARVAVAFLELQSPTLPEALEAAAEQGAGRIHIVPVFWAGAGHIENDLPPILTPFNGRYPDIIVRVLPVLSELPGLLDFVARVVARSIGDDPHPQPLSRKAGEGS